MNKPKILLPVHPQWCEKIFNGEKIIEVRKTVPKVDTPFEVLVYQTKYKGGKAIVNEVLNSVYGGGKVIGSFVCNQIMSYIAYISYNSDYEMSYSMNQNELIAACLNPYELSDYGKGKTLYGWYITEPKLFDRPRELSEFYMPCKWYEKGDGCPEDCGFFKQDSMIDRTDDFCEGKRPITWAPQSFVYVEEA